MPTTLQPHNQPPIFDPTTEQMRIRYAFSLAIIGLGIAAALAVFLVLRGWNNPSNVIAVVGLFTSVLGTLVGAFFGLQIGAAGREMDQQTARHALETARRSDTLARAALGALPPERAKEVLEQHTS